MLEFNNGKVFLKEWEEWQLEKVKYELNEALRCGYLTSAKGYKDIDLCGCYTSSGDYALFGICSDTLTTKDEQQLDYVVINKETEKGICFFEGGEWLHLWTLSSIDYLPQKKVSMLIEKKQKEIKYLEQLQSICKEWDGKIYNVKFKDFLTNNNYYLYDSGNRLEIRHKEQGYNDNLISVYDFIAKGLIYYPDPEKNTKRINYEKLNGEIQKAIDYTNKDIEHVKKTAKNINKAIEKAKKVEQLTSELKAENREVLTIYKRNFEYNLQKALYIY